MCKYGPRFFVGYKFLATGKRSERQRNRDMIGQTELHILQNYQTTPRSYKTDKENHCYFKDKINCLYGNPGSIAFNPNNFWH